MKRVHRNAPYRLARALFLSLATLGVALYIACSDDPARYQPLDNGDPASGAVVAGDVLDQGKSAVEGAVVVMEPLTNGAPATALLLKEHPERAGKLATPSAASSDDARRITLTDARGRFVFDRVPAGEYAIQVRADDHLGASANVDVPTAALTLDTIIVDVNLTPTGTFSGVATYENGTTHPNIVVYAQGTSYVAVTAPDGSYAITDVPVGTYTVRATHSHYLDDMEVGTLTYAGENLGLPAMLLRIDNNMAPVASVTIPGGQVMEAGVSINFEGTATDADGDVVLYEWDFEDDGVMDASSPLSGSTSHVFAVPGDYIVKLRVTDNKGATGLAASPVSVNASTPTEVYMSILGNDGNPGTQASPVLTLAQAYVVASNVGVNTIFAATGNYNEVPMFLGGYDVVGGHDPNTWTPAVGYTTFNVGTASGTANAIATGTNISRIRIVSSSQVTAASSIAFVSIGSTAALRFDTCWFQSANAGPTGPSGFSGAPGQSGSAGANGTNGQHDGPNPQPGQGGAGGSSPIGCHGGAGGVGGIENNVPSQAGSPGLCTGGSGGAGGNWGDPGQAGQNGVPGPVGAPGNQGAVASSGGSIVGTQWVPSAGGNGTAGAHGKGGGGGGGGGGQYCTFCDDGAGNGGGGGGGGGEAGTPGTGGSGGRASIAVLLVNSSPVFQNCTFQTGAGGTGAPGGSGGAGGAGGAGGIGSNFTTGEIGKGGNGGAGGAGGDGGAGAGGAGGPSVGIIYSLAFPPTIISASYTLGTPGPGGSGGQSGTGPFAPNGPTGASAGSLGL